jgi:phosphoglycerol transferase MdoB-like AlkP superfamily enzyme
MLKKLSLLLLSFLAVNLLAGFVYRLFFLYAFASPLELEKTATVFLCGLRLDIALMGFTLSVFGAISLLLLRVHFRLLFLLGFFATYLHLGTFFANILCFYERNQQVGERLFAYIANPAEIYVAVSGFVCNNVWLSLLFLSLSGILLYLGIRYGRKFQGQQVSLWQPKTNLVWTVLFIALCLCLPIDKVTVKKTKLASGWRLHITHPIYYTVLDNFACNQAIHNPTFMILREYLPGLFEPTFEDQLDNQEALRITQELLKLPGENADYPLLTEIKSDLNLGLRNVVILQIEGLSQSVLDRQENGQWVMPYVRKLASEGIYFPNIIHSFQGTAGGVFCAASSFPKAYDEFTMRYTAYETNGYYGSLAHILGPTDYEHYFFEGFRECLTEYMAFMGNQGYQSFSYYDFRDRLAAKNLLAEGEDTQGVVDHHLLQESAEILLNSRKKYFTAHIMTVTSHSPWKVPANFQSPLKNQYLQVFNYVDTCIEKFFETLRQSPKFAETLFVVVADHASITFGDNLLERLRIPVIFYNPNLVRMNLHGEHKVYGSQLDVLPTALALLGGKWPYSGMGKNLLALDDNYCLCLSMAAHQGYYFHDNWVFHYHALQKEGQLFWRENDKIILKNVGQEHKDVLARMLREYLALYETSRYLARQHKVFPRQKGK